MGRLIEAVNIKKKSAMPNSADRQKLSAFINLNDYSIGVKIRQAFYNEKSAKKHFQYQKTISA